MTDVYADASLYETPFTVHDRTSNLSLASAPFDATPHALLQSDAGRISEPLLQFAASDRDMPMRFSHQVQFLPVDSRRGERAIHALGDRTGPFRQPEKPQASAESRGHGIRDRSGRVYGFINNVESLTGR